MAKVLPVGNEQIVERDPMRRRQFPTERLFSFLRRLRPHVAPAIANPMHVDIHANSGLTIADRHHQVRCFSANPRQSDQLLDGVGDYASIHVQQTTADGMNGFSFRPVEPDGIDHAFDLLEREGQHGGWLVCQLEQPGTGFPCRLVFGPEAEETRYEDTEGVSIRVARHHAEDRLFPLPNLALDDSKRRSDLILAHGRRREMKTVRRI